MSKTTLDTNMSACAYKSINNVLSNNQMTDNLIEIHYDDSGNIVLIDIDYVKLNFICYQVSNSCLNEYNSMLDNGVDVPVGVFCGIPILSTVGVKIKFNIISINSVKCEYISEFLSGGINQTKLSLYLDIIPEGNMVFGLKTQSISGSIKMLIYEHLIVGKVPEFYFN